MSAKYPERVHLIALLAALVLAGLILWAIPGPKGETDTTPKIIGKAGHR